MSEAENPEEKIRPCGHTYAVIGWEGSEKCAFCETGGFLGSSFPEFATPRLWTRTRSGAESKFASSNVKPRWTPDVPSAYAQ